jgi:hypothetical protein
MAYKDLKNAKEAKQDEFYTQMVDIELEMKNYRDLFKGKIVLCNCDDPFESNFFKYFALNFNYLNLKKLIATCYDGSPFAGTQLDIFDISNVNKNDKRAFKIEISEIPDLNKDGAIDLTDVEFLLKSNKNCLTPLKGNGDFRSDECLELLKESDIVVTNPPFSLFREYIQQLFLFQKKFLILGNIGAVAYKEVFPLIKSNKLWLGQSIHSGDREFRIPQNYKVRSKSFRVDELGNRYVRVVGIRWFTNLNHKERHENLILYKRFSKEEFPKYDNYDAINVSSTQEIPLDYFGLMGVPVTFIDKYNPNQFEIIGMGTGDSAKEIGVKKNYRGRTDLAVTINGEKSCPYQRIIIRRK